MKEITLKIPDNKFKFFMDLIEQLGIEAKDVDGEIPLEDQELVRNRIKTAKQEDYISWNEAKEHLKYKSNDE
jgi:hypothetical protein